MRDAATPEHLTSSSLGHELPLQVNAAPRADAFEHGEECFAVFRNLILRCSVGGIPRASDDAISNQILQVADEHALGDLWDIALQLRGPHGSACQMPEDRSLPPAINDGKGGVDRTW